MRKSHIAQADLPTCYVREADLELFTLLLLPAQHCNLKCVPPFQAWLQFEEFLLALLVEQVWWRFALSVFVCLKKIFVTPSFLLKKKGFPGHSFLNWQDIPFFSTVQLLCHSLLTCAVSAKKYVVVRIRYHYLLFLFSCGFE